MKTILKRLLFVTLSLGIIGAAPLLSSNSSFKEASADSTTLYPRNGNSGNILYVNGSSTYFNSGQADLAVYYFNSASDYAWSDKVSYRVFNDILRVMIPYKDGVSKTWSKYIVCRYNPSMDPATDGFAGVYNQTNDIEVSSMLYAHNTVNITGYDGDKMTYAFSSNDYYGIKNENHMYLDLSGFTSWEEGDAKFAIYFACPSGANESRWSQAYSLEGYYASFCWKVNGQDNDHLYECIVPSIYPSGTNLWNLVIAVRYNPVASQPGWDNVWNQTQNLSFNANNHNSNIIHINDWNNGQLDTTNKISEATRLEFYGRYFLNTVTCSGNGNSDATTSAMWNAVKDEYIYHLSRIYQGDVWTCTADSEGSLIAQAMARYDYIVLYKQYNHNDFINRQDSPNKTEYASMNTLLLNNNTNPIEWAIIAVILTFAILSLSFLIISRAHQRKRIKK